MYITIKSSEQATGNSIRLQLDLFSVFAFGRWEGGGKKGVCVLTNNKIWYFSCSLPSLSLCLLGRGAFLLLITHSYFKQAKTIEKNTCEIEHAISFDKQSVSGICIMESDVASEQIRSQMQSDLFIVSVKTQRKTKKATRDACFSLACISQLRSSSRTARGMWCRRTVLTQVHTSHC